MSPVVPPLVLGAVLVASAVAGPALFRRSAPALVRWPRLAVAVLVGSALLWLGALLALGPMTAWSLSGPALLPDGAAEVCARCVASANPFGGASFATAVPTLPALLLPVAVLLVVAASVGRQVVTRRRANRAVSAALVANGVRTTLAGYRVLLVRDGRPTVFALPRRWGGVVVSDGALRVLDAGELAAVLAHEEAHLRQRHHLVALVVAGLARPLRWVPLVAAAAEAVPHYLEIAADDAARRRAGTPALAAALLTLGEPVAADPGHPGTLLHAAGPDRIRHLVAPAAPGAGAGPAAVTLLQSVTLAGLGVSVHVLYLGAVFTGCV